MRLIYTVTPLDNCGNTIPAKPPYNIDGDPMERNNRVLFVDDEVLSAKGLAGAKEKRRILDSTVRCFSDHGKKPPLTLPLSCVQVRVTAGKRESDNRYEALYNISTLPYKPCDVSITDPESPFADYLGQKFAAEWTHWPFGAPEERRGWITIHFSEELPFPDDSQENIDMGKEMARSRFPRVGIRLTGRALRFGIAEVIGSRIKPAALKRTSAASGRRS